MKTKTIKHQSTHLELITRRQKEIGKGEKKSNHLHNYTVKKTNEWYIMYNH